MMSGYRSSDRKLKMHQILKASSLLMVSLLWSRFLRLHSVQHILLNSCWSKLPVTCSSEETGWESKGDRVGIRHQRERNNRRRRTMMMMMMMACLHETHGEEIQFFTIN